MRKNRHFGGVHPFGVLATVALSLLVSGCGSDSPSGPNDRANVIGIWEIVAVDGEPLPWVEQDGPTRREIVGGALRLSETQDANTLVQCERVSGAGYPQPQVTWQSTDIGWSVSGVQITVNIFLASQMRTVHGTLSGTEMVLDFPLFPERVYRFRKVTDEPGTLPGCSQLSTGNA